LPGTFQFWLLGAKGSAAGILGLQRGKMATRVMAWTQLITQGN
jgi:hypothetical protein